MTVYKLRACNLVCSNQNQDTLLHIQAKPQPWVHLSLLVGVVAALSLTDYVYSIAGECLGHTGSTSMQSGCSPVILAAIMGMMQSVVTLVLQSADH